MGYWISLKEPDTQEPVVLGSPHHMKGGTYAVGGSPTAELSITYNYAEHYYRVFGEDGIRTIYDKTGAESIPILEEASSKLGDNLDPDYWEPTEGNAKQALLQLLALAHERPDAIWEGD